MKFFGQLLLVPIASALLAFICVAPFPWYVLAIIPCILFYYAGVHWLISGELPSFRFLCKHTPAPEHPLVGQRLCRVEMRGCMAETRGEELWGTIIAVENGLCERGIIYDGGASADSRKQRLKLGQDTWAKVRYDERRWVIGGMKHREQFCHGSLRYPCIETWEPVWWLVQKEGHWEHQI